MSPVTRIDVHRTAGHAGPFPGVGVGVLGDVRAAAVSPPVAAPAAGGLPVALVSGPAASPQEASEATSDAAAAVRSKLLCRLKLCRRNLPWSRRRGLGLRVPMPPSYGRGPHNTPGNPLRTAAVHERVIS
jgi:hypothetical protein